MLLHILRNLTTLSVLGENASSSIEAKKPCVHIEREDNPTKQVRRYGFTAGLKISVLSNFEHLFIYDTFYPVEQNDTLSLVIYSRPQAALPSAASSFTFGRE